MSDNNKYTVAVIDDEPMVTQSIRNFLALETDYEVLVYNSPREALEALQDKTVDVVISDYPMPDLDGIDKRALLRRLAEKVSELDKASAELKGVYADLLKAFK